MARGWESKSVEEQIDAAAERSARFRQEEQISQADSVRRREIEGLELSRTRVMNDMAATTKPRYREELQKSLDFLDAKLKALEESTDV